MAGEVLMKLVVVACSLTGPPDCDRLETEKKVAVDSENRGTSGAIVDTLLWLSTRPDKVIYSMTFKEVNPPLTSNESENDDPLLRHD